MKLLKIKKLVTRCWPLAILLMVIGVFFWRFLFRGLLPIPADTIVGMYHPWRDVVWDNFSTGVPFKNFLITDSVRQLYPWRQLVVDTLKHGQLPLWNPYSFAGTPLLANFQSAPFYIFNLLFFIFNFPLAWSLLIFIQPLLAGFFTYFYLRELGLKQIACLIGAISFSFSGFFVAWLEWGTVLHSALWLPLILLSIEKISIQLSKSKFLIWSLIFVFSLTQSFFVGHLQVFFYIFLFSFIYLIWKLFQVQNGRFKLFLLFTIYYLLFTILTFIQWRPTLEFIKLSARNVDQVSLNQPGWFIPWQNLVQFFVPDFFGNPTTLNYWGIFNYGEFIGYIGVISLMLAFYAFFSKKNKITIYYLLFTILFLSFALPTPWAKLPYKMGIPLISTSQPTRLLVIVDFCLAMLAAVGLEALLEKRKRFIPMIFPALVWGFLWIFVFLAPKLLPNASWVVNLAVSKRNLILPTGLFFTFIVILGVYHILIYDTRLKRVFQLVRGVFVSGVLFLIIFDLLRFGWKFTPFTKKDWIFPSTGTIEFLKNDKKPFRFMSTDRKIFPPNFSVAYRLQTVDGYDPLYLLRYGELIAASERGKPDISPPFGFNRIITPQNYNSRIIDLLNVKYILSLTDLSSPKLSLVHQEGETRVYYNKDSFPRAFMVYNYRFAENKQKAIDLLMDESINLRKKVILEEDLPVELIKLTNEDIANNVTIELYEENKVVVSVETLKKGILVLTDSYYPGWKATVGGEETKIYLADYNFRAVIIPSGKHKVVFRYEP